MPRYDYKHEQTGEIRTFKFTYKKLDERPELLVQLLVWDEELGDWFYWNRVYTDAPAIQFRGSGWAGKS